LHKFKRQKYKKDIIKKHKILIQDLIYDIVALRENIDRKINDKNKSGESRDKSIFHPSIQMESYILRLSENVAHNANLLEKYSIDLLKYLGGSKNKKLKSILKDDNFFELLRTIRNSFAHDPSIEEPFHSDGKFIELYDKIEELIGIRIRSFHHEFDLNCIQIQIALLQKCRAFLQQIEEKI